MAKRICFARTHQNRQVLDQLASLSKHVGAERPWGESLLNSVGFAVSLCCCRLGIPLMLRQFSAFLKAATLSDDISGEICCVWPPRGPNKS